MCEWRQILWWWMKAHLLPSQEISRTEVALGKRGTDTERVTHYLFYASVLAVAARVVLAKVTAPVVLHPVLFNSFRFLRADHTTSFLSYLISFSSTPLKPIHYICFYSTLLASCQVNSNSHILTCSMEWVGKLAILPRCVWAFSKWFMLAWGQLFEWSKLNIGLPLVYLMPNWSRQK